MRSVTQRPPGDEHDRRAAPRRGDLFWVDSAALRGDQPGQLHPYLVVQDDVFNRSRISTLVMCATTTNPRRASEPGNVLLEPGEGDLPRQSVIVVSQVDSVPRAALGAYIGSLRPERVEQVLDGLRLQQRSFFHE